MDTPKISIAIPCYEMHQKGAFFLNKLLTTVEKQTYKNIQVVISDHSIDNKIETEAEKWKEKFDIKYIRNKEGVGSSSANINCAIRNCDGDIIKPIFQDDFIYDDRLLEMIAKDFFPSQKMWGAVACNHTDEGQNSFFHNWIPTYQGHDAIGTNKIGAPSVIFFKNNKTDFFDDILIWLMDCEFYHRLYLKYGEPFICSDVMMTIRQWDKTVSNTLATHQVRKKEAQYVITKHNL